MKAAGETVAGGSELVARGWRVFDLGDPGRIVVWDHASSMLAAVPRAAGRTIEAVAANGGTLRSAFAGSGR